MSRVVLNYDDGTKTDFTDLADALYHVARQGAAGVTNLTGEADGKVILPRRSLDARVKTITDEPDPDNRLALARDIAKET